MGGGNGGCTSGRKEIIEWLRQRSRPYLFSNTLAPATVGATLKAIDLLEGSPALPNSVMAKAKRFREGMEAAGFDLVKGNTAIIPVMIYDEPKAISFANELLREGIYVIGFVFPVVPRGKARIRVQISAAHSEEQIDRAVEAFVRVGLHFAQ
jgi:glycine C-acetyltransferase